MGWTDSHSHVFTVGDSRIGMCFDDYPEGEVDEDSVAVLATLRGRDQLMYEYDFGVSWSHAITIEREFLTPHSLKYAICLDGENACPPEDCGGGGGFDYALRALAYLRWLGPTFDPSAFDRNEIYAILQKVRQRTRHN
jgi:hypothetical protein